jgi:hypothetical protein
MVDAAESVAMDWAKFLASAAPDSEAEISNLCRLSGTHWVTQTPDVFLH